MRNRENCFDLIRHFAAFLVLFTHHFALSKLPEPTFLHWDTYGYVAVVIFFALSGYLMPGSFTRSGNFLVFMAKRCRRIFPGLIVCSIFMSYVLGALFSTLSVTDYLFSFAPFKTSLMYSTFIGRTIPGVFSNYIYGDAINGSLWTLPVEFASYIIIGIALSFANNWKSVLVLFGFAAFITQVLAITKLNYSFYAIPLNYLALFGIAFTTAAFMGMTKHHWFPVRFYLAIAAIALLIVLQGRPELPILGTISLAVLTIVIGVSFKDKVINGKFDISYGVYIYAFPLQQMVINLITVKFWLSMGIAAVLSIIAGFLSYHFIEKPFLYANAQKRRARVEEPANSTATLA